MFALYQNGIVPGARNAWTAWTDRILEKKANFGFSKVAMVTTSGEVLWYTGNFLPTSHEVQAINHLFVDKVGNNGRPPVVPGVDRITIHGSTYITKAVPAEALNGGVKQLVAFSGDKYVLISRSKTIYVVVLSEGRRGRSPTWLTEALSWLAKLCIVLVQRNY